MRSPYQSAVLLAAILNRSDLRRARVSTRTVKLVAARQNLRSAFVLELSSSLAELGWMLCEIPSGGFAAIQAKTLEAAKSVTAKRWLTDEERKASRDNTLEWSALEAEVSPQGENDIDED